MDLLLLILSSPSGAGKSTLSRHLIEQIPELTFSISHTTRAPRGEEKEGREYYFVNREQFLQKVENGDFAEWAEVHGNLYGTSLDELQRARSEKKIGIIFDVDHQGARQIKATRPDAVRIFILPPSLGELRRRLIARDTDDADTVLLRMAKAREEIAHYSSFDYLIINDVLKDAKRAIVSIVRAEQCRETRMAQFVEAFLRHSTDSATH